jgi:hypothetical protein
MSGCDVQESIPRRSEKEFLARHQSKRTGVRAGPFAIVSMMMIMGPAPDTRGTEGQPSVHREKTSRDGRVPKNRTVMVIVVHDEQSNDQQPRQDARNGLGPPRNRAADRRHAAHEKKESQ